MDNYCDFYFPLNISFQIAQQTGRQVIETTRLRTNSNFTQQQLWADDFQIPPHHQAVAVSMGIIPNKNVPPEVRRSFLSAVGFSKIHSFPPGGSAGGRRQFCYLL